MPRLTSYLNLSAGLLLSLGSLAIRVRASGSQRPLHIQWLIDYSGSYTALPSAVRSAVETCRALRTGDHLVVRRIWGHSYSSSSVVIDVALPLVEVRRFENPNRAARDRAAVQVAQERREHACATLERSLGERRAHATDISGSLATAATAFQSSAPGSKKVLLVSSDLDQNVRPGNISLSLAGVSVRFVAVESRTGTLEQLQRRIVSWEAMLQEAGASGVKLIAPGDAVQLDALRADDTSPRARSAER